MAQFAPVAPVQILKGLFDYDPRKLFGDYHLLLAHHTVEKPRDFHELFLEVRNSFRNNNYGPRVIMDNSIVELGGSVDDNMIREATNIITDALGNKSNVIPVLPDVMNDGKGTVELAREAYDRWYSKRMPGDHYMLVTQGTDWEDFLNTVDYFFLHNYERYRNICWVGIPRVLVKTLGSRERAIRYVQAIAPNVKIHLLGFSDNVVDDIFCARMPGVIGIDSAVPVRVADHFYPTMPVPPRDPKWFDEGSLTNGACQNIRNFRKWIRQSNGHPSQQ